MQFLSGYEEIYIQLVNFEGIVRSHDFKKKSSYKKHFIVFIWVITVICN